MRGMVLLQLGRAREAIAAFDVALGASPDADIWNNRGAALQSLGCFAEALASFDSALAMSSSHIGACMNSGLALLELKRYEEALAVFEALLDRNPDTPAVLIEHGNAMQALGRFPAAMKSYDRALALQPDNARGWNNRAVALRGLKRYEDAIADLAQALRLLPDYAEAWLNHGLVLQVLKRFEEALASFDKALDLQPDYLAALTARGWLLCEMGNIEGGLALLEGMATINPSEKVSLADQPHKQRHDAEQLFYLSSDTSGQSDTGQRVKGSALNLEEAKMAAVRWASSKPNLVVVDNFLSSAALERLRHFCWRARVWQIPYSQGYLGAFPNKGFCCPLLAQIAADLVVAYPTIIEHHKLRMLWGFKYDSDLSGIQIHADQAAINVNFWITPDEANCDPEHGGLIIWDVKAPADWNITKYNGDDVAVRKFLAEKEAKPITIPYRANRAVIFDSDLFHETDTINFRSGYLNRRINVTMLFGRRTSDGS